MRYDDYHEYVELFEYFGRGGMVRLERNEFDQLSAEWNLLMAKRPKLDDDDLERVSELRKLLFRDRPTMETLRGER